MVWLEDILVEEIEDGSGKLRKEMGINLLLDYEVLL